MVIIVKDNNETSPVSANRVADSASTTGPVAIALKLIAIPIGALIVPIVVALVLNRRFQRGNPGKRGYRWGYYFGVMSLIAGLVLGLLLEGATALIVCGLIYAVLAWFFSQRHHWAWIALTILSFNPVAWIINLIYLRKRWAEDSVELVS